MKRDSGGTSRAGPLLTRAESEIMAALWKHGRLTVHEVIDVLDRPVAYTTVLTVLRNLGQKGYVQHEPHPQAVRTYVYLPAVPASEVRSEHVLDLVDRLFDGHAEDLVIGLVREERLGRAHLEALRAYIDETLSEDRSELSPADDKTKEK